MNKEGHNNFSSKYLFKFFLNESFNSNDHDLNWALHLNIQFVREANEFIVCCEVCKSHHTSENYTKDDMDDINHHLYLFVEVIFG